MDKETISNYRKAGEITKECQELSRKKLKVGSTLYGFAEEIESAIIKKGGFPAFPINLSINHVAAHYTPSFESEDILPEDAVIKVDIGVHVDGFIADSAFTMDFSEKHSAMVKASEDALEAAVAMAKEGIEVGKIGEKIEATIRGKGFSPIQNLSGHGVDEYDAHVAPSIPNINTHDTRTIEDGMAIAIEPFCTDGKGFVREGNQAEIFQLVEEKPMRGAEARKILEFISENYSTLPFAERWIQRDMKISEFARKVGFRELMQKKCITAFPLLKEDEGRIVTQSETTLLFNEGKVIRLL
ncbi:MAG: type II methionyl aminopeptidase [Candidatus Diapherotrites archaeon CG11_big_fil_rev_8_21_14_0_20_37_9]|nr:MAG: type II methionyl aminopeptidase [Candidatus Diapherotrites archaeon CG11_big_fil_rev_8_21_14_0_20_37_9]